MTNDTPAARLSRRPQTCVGGVTGQESDARASALSRSEKRGRQSAEGPVMQGVAPRNRDAPAVHILPRDLFAAVRIIREAGFRALRYLSGSFEELVARGAGVAPRELRAHLWRARGGAEPLRQIMKESRAPSWPGWGSERDALAGALDAGERFHAAEVHAVKFVDFLMEALVFEAKTDEERVAEMADSGRVVGQGLGHGAGATLADSLFQLLSAAGWRGQALASDDARRVACAACMECLRNVGDAWLALGSRARELRLAVHAGEIRIFGWKRYGAKDADPPGQVIARMHSRFDGEVGPGVGLDIKFARADLEGWRPRAGRVALRGRGGG